MLLSQYRTYVFCITSSTLSTSSCTPLSESMRIILSPSVRVRTCSSSHIALYTKRCLCTSVLPSKTSATTSIATCCPSPLVSTTETELASSAVCIFSCMLFMSPESMLLPAGEYGTSIPSLPACVRTLVSRCPLLLVRTRLTRARGADDDDTTTTTIVAVMESL